MGTALTNARNSWQKASSSALLLMFVLTLVLANSFWLYIINIENKEVVADLFFDMEQFIRAAFLLITVFSTLYFLQLLNNAQNKNLQNKWQKSYTYAISAWIGLLVIGYGFAFVRGTKEFSTRDRKPNAWIETCKKELTAIETPKLIAAFPDGDYSAQFLTSCDIGTFWTAIKRGEGGCCSKFEPARFYVLDKIVSNDSTMYSQALIALKTAKVTHLLANPTNEKEVRRFVLYAKLQPLATSQYCWVVQ